MTFYTSRSKNYLAVCLVACLFSTCQLAGACRGGQRQESLRSFKSEPSTGSTVTTVRYYIHKLNSEENLNASKSNIRARQGDEVYARAVVPSTHLSETGEWTLTVLATWTERHYTTPLWLFIKRGDLPTTKNWDKTSISFVSRSYSRIRIENATPGPYYLMMEALTDLYNVTMTVAVTPGGNVNEVDSVIFRDNKNIFYNIP